MKIIFLLIFIFFTPIKINAHEGKIFPILVDKQIGKNNLSILADPDIGKGSFDLFIDGDEHAKYQIQLKASPINDPAHILKAAALFLTQKGQRQNFRAVLPFDREVMWNVEFIIKQNESAENTISLPVEITSPGPSKGEFALYFLPFLLVFLLGLKIFVTKRKFLSKSLK